MKKISAAITIVIAIFVLSGSSFGQFYQMGNGSYMTGYGQVYGSFGYAMATQRMYQTTQLNLQRSMARAAMVEKWGEAAVRKAEQEAAQKNSSSKPEKATSSSSSNPQIIVPPSPPAPKYYGKYRPDASVNMANQLSNLFEKPEERQQMKMVVEAVQKIYREEAVNKKWGNNLAGGMTFFLVILSTIYHDTAQPNNEAMQAIFDAVNESVDAVPEFAKASDKDKNTLNDMLVGFSALPFLTYIEGKKEGNADTIKTSQILAGEMIKMILKTEPQNVRFDGKSLTISK